MARTKYNQRSAPRVDVPMGATGGRTPPSKVSVAILAVSIVAAVWAVAMMTPAGRVGYYYFFAYSEYYMGVITLVSLSITIMVGLVATDRLVLSIRQRVLLQTAHRTTGIIAVSALVLHVWTKVLEQHVRLIDVFVPFLTPYNTLYIGFGTVAGWVMMIVMWSGLARARFIGRGKPWMWRAVHAVSYLMWPIALLHGLSAGRAADPWVIVSYVVCVLGVLVGLAVRLSVSLNRRKDFSSTATGQLKPVGKLVPTAAPSAAAAAVKKRMPSRRAEIVDDRLVSGAAPEQWKPAAPPRPQLSAAPASAAPASAVPAGAVPAGDRRGYADQDRPRSRRDRYAEQDDRYDTGTRMSRYADDDRGYDDEPRYDTGEIRRGHRYADDDDRYDTGTRMSRYEAADEDDRPRGRRHAEPDDRYAGPPAPRRRRAAPDDRYDEPTRPIERRRPEPDRYEETVPRPRRAVESRHADDGPPPRRSDSGRHSRAEFVDLAADIGPRRGRPDPNYLEPDDTPTLVDIASRRARRAGQPAAERPRGRRARPEPEPAEDGYWRTLRGEAQ